MKKLTALALAAALVAVPAAPALAGWKLIDAGEQVKVAKSTMQVTPGEDWNRWTVRPVKKGEVWTLDGTSLNEVYFVGGLTDGDTMYRDLDKKERPLPKVSKSMDLTEIPGFVESSTRIALNTSVFNMTNVEPTTFAGQQAVRFTFDYAVEGGTLKRKGLGVGTMKNGSLYLITFVAPETYFYDRDIAKVEAIIASATL